MEPLYTTTVSKLVEATKERIKELETARSEKRREIFTQAQSCDIFEKMKDVLNSYNENAINIKLSQYRENLEYLEACAEYDTTQQVDRWVDLNQTEWRHYFHGAPRPELC